jgi:nitroreductase
MLTNFQEIVKFRHACKIFDETKKIPSDILRKILEDTILSPSSFGIEGWKFLVVQNQEIKEKLKPHCWNQPQITTCSDLVVLLYRKNMKSSDKYVLKSLKRRKYFEKSLEKYSEFIDNRTQENIECWSKAQTYIASAFLMLSASSFEIDSCPIEGFEYEKVYDILDFDKENYDISYMVALGYRLKPQQKRDRREFEELVEFIR